MFLKRTLAASSIGLLVLLGSARADEEILSLLPADNLPHDRFGTVAISGTTAVIGAMGNDPNGQLSGSAYLFDLTTGAEFGKLIPNDGAPWDVFGSVVAVDGTTAVIAAPGDDDNGSNSGSAYLFDIGTGLQTAKLLPSDGAADLEFGEAVAIGSGIAVVGMRRDDAYGFWTGAAYLFDASTGQQLMKLLPTTVDSHLFFGTAVAISGDIVLVGAPGEDGAAADSGVVYLFDVNTGQEIGKLLATDGEISDGFGGAIAVDGDLALVGAPDNDDNGSAYLFDILTGVQLAKYVAGDGAPNDDFGSCVSIDGGNAMIGARADTDNGDISGSAYLFDIATGLETAKLLPSVGTTHDGFDMNVAIRGSFALYGVPSHDGNGYGSGGAFLFAVPSSIGTNYCGPANANSSGKFGVLSAIGLESAAANKVRLFAEDMALQQFGMFITSQQQGFVVPPGSQGNLCLAGAIGRYKNDIMNTGADGAFDLQLDLTDTPTPSGPVAVLPGETWNFQAWFRDKNPNQTSNFTDGLSILFR